MQALTSFFGSFVTVILLQKKASVPWSPDDFPYSAFYQAYNSVCIENGFEYYHVINLLQKAKLTPKQQDSASLLPLVLAAHAPLACCHTSCASEQPPAAHMCLVSTSFGHS